MIVFFELEHDCKEGSLLASASNKSLRAYAGRILAKCNIGVIVHRGEGKVIKRRHGDLTFRVQPLIDIAEGL